MRIFATNAQCDLVGHVADDTDLDDVFTLTCDDGEVLLVHGWLFLIEIEPPDKCPPPGIGPPASEPPVWEEPDGFL